MTDIQQPFAYTDRDYLSLRDQLKNYVQGQIPDWTADPSDFGTVLVEAMAYMGDMLSYYVDLAAQESNILSSNSPGNIFAHAALFGYQPGMALSAQTTLQLQYKSNLASPPDLVEVPYRTRVYDANSGLVFETQEPTTIEPGTPVVVQAWEGSTRIEQIGTSVGTANQRFTVPLDAETFVDGRPDTLKVTCSNAWQTTEWRPTYNLLDHGPSDQVFALITDSLGNSSVYFGDGSSGAIPPSGMTVVLEYRQCSGTLGNTVEIGAIDQWWDTYALPASAVAVLDVANITQPAGGTAVESIDSIREQTVKFARAQRRAVSSDDYARVARASGAIMSAAASATVWSQPRVWVLPRDENLLTGLEAEREAVLDELDESITALSMVGSSPVITFGRVTPVRVAVEVHVWQPVNLRTAADRVRTAILNRFSYANADFDKEITEDLLLRVIRDTVPDDVVRFAQVTSVTGDALTTLLASLYPGFNQVDADYDQVKGVRPVDGAALVIRNEDLVITVRGPGKKYVDVGSTA